MLDDEDTVDFYACAMSATYITYDRCNWNILHAQSPAIMLQLTAYLSSIATRRRPRRRFTPWTQADSLTFSALSSPSSSGSTKTHQAIPISPFCTSPAASPPLNYLTDLATVPSYEHHRPRHHPV